MNDNECGELLDDEAAFDALADKVFDVLKDADPEHEIDVLVMFLGLALSGIRPEDRQRARADIIDMLDSDTQMWVVGRCDA